MSTIAYYPIFGTIAELPAELNNALATLPRGVDGQVQNCLVLCLSPDQLVFNHGFTPTTQPLTSYFIDWDMLSLSHFCDQTIAYIPSASPDHCIDSATFLIIDGKTLLDETLRVVSTESETINEDVIFERNWCPWDCKDVLETVRCGIKDLGGAVAVY